MVMIVLMLHAFHDLFQLQVFAHGFRQADGDQVGIHGGFEHVFHPLVAFAADVDEQVRGGNGHDVLGGGLIGVKIHAVVQQQHQVGVFIFTDNLAGPVIDREDGGDDGHGLAFGNARAGDKADQQHQGKHKCENLFHSVISSGFNTINSFLGMKKQESQKRRGYPEGIRLPLKFLSLIQLIVDPGFPADRRTFGMKADESRDMEVRPGNGQHRPYQLHGGDQAERPHQGGRHCDGPADRAVLAAAVMIRFLDQKGRRNKQYQHKTDTEQQSVSAFACVHGSFPSFLSVFYHSCQVSGFPDAKTGHYHTFSFS